MTVAETMGWNEFMSTLSVPLDSLIGADVQAALGEIVDDWELPLADRAALRRWGLPFGLFLEPGPQKKSRPTLTPNIAGEQERRLVAPDEELYRLCSWVSSDDPLSAVGAVIGSGRVLGLMDSPITEDDLHPQLRSYYAGIYVPAVSLINSSVAAFVEISWRWLAACRVLEAIEASWDGLSDFIEEHGRYLRLFVEGLLLIDPAMANEVTPSLWLPRIIDGWTTEWSRDGVRLTLADAARFAPPVQRVGRSVNATAPAMFLDGMRNAVPPRLP